jgi:hypothetical protein
MLVFLCEIIYILVFNLFILYDQIDGYINIKDFIYNLDSPLDKKENENRIQVLCVANY